MLLVLALVGLGAARAQGADLDTLRLLYTLPDPGVAAALSGTIGFGAGHFYAGQPGSGAMHFTVQALGTGLLIGGIVAASRGKADPGAVTGLTISGAGLLSVGRLADALTAHGAARSAALAELERRAASTARSPTQAAEAAGNLVESTTEQIYRALGWPINTSKPQWWSDLDVVRGYLDRGRTPSELIRAAPQGADKLGVPSTLDVYLQTALGE